LIARTHHAQSQKPEIIKTKSIDETQSYGRAITSHLT
jgi:hypothetical protein